MRHAAVPIGTIIEAYKSTGSVWRAAKHVGLSGQSVWERLRAIGHELQGQKWTADEIEELTELAGTCTLGEIASRLGRPYAGVALKLSRLGIAGRTPFNRKKKIPRGAGLNKEAVHKLIKALDASPLSLRQFCRNNGLDIDLFVTAVQHYNMVFWAAYTKRKGDLGEKSCSYCGTAYYPLTKKQETCTRRCQGLKRRDAQYFGGKRRNTIGLAEGICQLCRKYKPKALSSHHVLGKEHDPDNNYLIALCPGCHQLVGQLATRVFTMTEQGWEDLISLCLLRKASTDAPKDTVAVHACVEIEWLTKDDLDTDE
jgi:hypothetical protein